jgi:hypothetical protein
MLAVFAFAARIRSGRVNFAISSLAPIVNPFALASRG